MTKKSRLADRIISVCGAAFFVFIGFSGIFYHDIFTTLLRHLYEKTGYFCEI